MDCHYCGNRNVNRFLAGINWKASTRNIVSEKSVLNKFCEKGVYEKVIRLAFQNISTLQRGFKDKQIKPR